MGRTPDEKYRRLKEILARKGRAAVAFSAGVDSTFLLKTAHDVLGENVTAVTVRSVFCPGREAEEAEAFCRKEGIRHLFCDMDVLSVPGVAGNPPDRCYLCKRAIFTGIRNLARQEGTDHILEGSNADDAFDYRPGRRALSELSVESPLAEAGLTKQEIRILSAELGLETASKPSMACLASRIPYGEIITEEKLFMIEKAEEELRNLGLCQFRVRVHGTLARIEVLPDDFERIMQKEIRESLAERFHQLGFSYVSLDLDGFRSGSMNEVLQQV